MENNQQNNKPDLTESEKELLIDILKNEAENTYKMVFHIDESRFKMLQYYFTALAGLVTVVGWLITKSSSNKDWISILEDPRGIIHPFLWLGLF